MSFWRANGKALAMNETEGMLKLFASSAGEILGAHAYGAHVADIIHFILYPMHKSALNPRHVSALHAKVCPESEACSCTPCINLP